jgi:hypothetical protein
VDGFTVMVASLVLLIKARCASGHADDLTALGGIRGRHFIFCEDGLKGALRDARSAVDASVWIDVKPRPLGFWLAGDDALNRANVDTASVTQTKAGNNVGHGTNLPCVEMDFMVKANTIILP